MMRSRACDKLLITVAICLLYISDAMREIRGGGNAANSRYDIDQERRYYNDLEPTIFSPSGSLHAVEKVFHRATSAYTVDEETDADADVMMLGGLSLALVCGNFLLCVAIKPSFVVPRSDAENEAKISSGDASNDETNVHKSLFLEDFTDQSVSSSPFVLLDKSILGTAGGEPVDAACECAYIVLPFN